LTYTQIPLFADNDTADRERLNAILTNLDHLNQNKVAFRLAAYADQATLTEGLRIASGTMLVNTPSNYYRVRAAATGTFFTPGFRPIATATFATMREFGATVTIAGRTRGTAVNLDHTGVSARVQVGTARRLGGEHRIHYTMIGV
jgi:hypothetical protein